MYSDSDEENIEKINEKIQDKEASVIEENFNVKTQPLLRKISIRDIELEREEFLIELRRILQSVDVQKDIDIDELIEMIVAETRHFKP